MPAHICCSLVEKQFDC